MGIYRFIDINILESFFAEGDLDMLGYLMRLIDS